MSPHRETLVAFYTWQNPDQISNIDKILEAYNGREPALLQELGRNFPLCVGWSDARGCLKHYLTRERPDIEKDVDTILQTWHSENKGSMEEEDARLAGGHFTLMYAAFDVRYSTTHFSQWLRLVDLYHTYDSAKAPQLKHDIPAFLDACKGAESAATDEVQLQYDNFTAEMKMWITRFYKRHKPEKLDKIDTIMESHKGSLSSIILRVTLHRLYVAEKYLTAATWSSSHPGHWNIRFALLEYFQEKDPEKLVILDTILEAYPPADLVRHLYSTYEPEYLKHLAAKKLEPAKVLFPPWRNPDYPQEMPQGMPRFQGTIPAEGTQQPDLLTLDERLYPIEKEEDKEKLEAENKAAEERIALEKKAAEEEEKIEAEKKAAEEKLAMEKKEMNEKIDAENKAAEERIAMEKKAAEEEEKIEAENRIAMERKAAEEKERIEQEEKEDEESRKRAEEDEKLRKELETEEHEKREAVHQTENEVWGEIQESAKVDAADRTRRQSFFTPSEQLNSVASQLLQPNAAPSATRRMVL